MTLPPNRTICSTKKVRYLSEQRAYLVLLRIQNLRHARGQTKTERYPYQCHWCKGWHLTSRED